MCLSWQNFCRDKIMFVATSILLCFGTTITRLSWQKLYLWQLPPMVLHRHHHTTTLHDDDWQEAHVRVCMISRCPLTQCWTKIKVTAWATAAFRQANNCAWPAGVPSLNAGLKTRCHCLGNCCIQKGKCQCITSRCPITKCWTSKNEKKRVSVQATGAFQGEQHESGKRHPHCCGLNSNARSTHDRSQKWPSLQALPVDGRAPHCSMESPWPELLHTNLWRLSKWLFTLYLRINTAMQNYLPFIDLNKKK